MLLIKTYVAPSRIHGLGLFAGQDILKGTITWRFHPALDIVLTEEQVGELPEVAREFVAEYGSLSKVSGKYIVSSDSARFTNHSDSPNLDSKEVEGEPERVALANRDIKKGEELTIDYEGFDQLSVNGI